MNQSTAPDVSRETSPHRAALLAQLRHADTLGAQQAIFAVTFGLKEEAARLHPGPRIVDATARQGFVTSHWQAFTESLAPAGLERAFAVQLVFALRDANPVMSPYGACDCFSFRPEWGTIIAVYTGGERLSFEELAARAPGLANLLAPSGPRRDFCELHPERRRAWVNANAEMFAAARAAGLGTTQRDEMIEAICRTLRINITSRKQLTIAELHRMAGAFASGMWAPGWDYVPELAAA